jgi:hypothetical protein
MFYTYLYLRENGTPYYVGKGKEKRAYQSGKNHYPPKDKTYIILQEFLSEEDAFTAEKFLIAYYGRKDRDHGLLRNLTDGGEGLTGNPEVARRNAFLGGKKAVESGQIFRLAASGLGGRFGGKIGGKTSGRHHRERGTGIFTQGAAARGGHLQGLKNAAIPNRMSELGKRGAHKAFHVNRGVNNPRCKYCQPALESKTED